MSNKEISQNNCQENKPQLRDLQSLLQTCYSNKELKVTDQKVDCLLPLGENYCSVMMRIDVNILRSKDAKEETLHLVAKTINKSERPIIDWHHLLPKEVFIYDELIPMYRSIEREAGIKETDIIDILPRYVGHRFSLDSRANHVDEDSLLLMENIKSRGYYNGDRRKGLNVDHAKKALSALARYHALGIVAEQKRSDFFKKSVAQAQVLGIDFEQLDEGFASIFKSFNENPCFSKHLKKIESIFNDTYNGKSYYTVPKKPWATITHGDFWVNNILFHKDDNGNVDDVKFVDFQTYLYNSPLKDLPYFLCGSLDDETKEQHFDNLINSYYKAFIGTVEKIGCDTAPFSRSSFNLELKKQALNEFPLCALAIKFFTHDAEVDAKNSGELMTNIFDSKGSDAYMNKLMQLITIFEKKGWF